MNQEFPGSPPEAAARQLGHRLEQRVEPNVMARGKNASTPPFGPLQMFWLHAAETRVTRPPAMGCRPSHDDCQ